MKEKVGMYHYCRRFTAWAVYKCTEVNERGASFSKVASYATREEARNEVYRLNGWGTPKNN